MKGKVLCTLDACVNYNAGVCKIRQNRFFTTRNTELRDCSWFEIALASVDKSRRLSCLEIMKALSEAGCPANNTKCLALLSNHCCMIEPDLRHGNSTTGITCGSYMWEVD